MMKKKVMVSVMAAMMMLSSSITALAAPEVISVNGNNAVFDWEYYANAYPDVAAEVGAGREALIQHYVSFGQRENRETYAAGTDVEAILAAYQEVNPAAETIVPVQTEKKQLLRKDRHYIDYRHDGSVSSENDYSASYEYDARGNLIKAINLDFRGWSYEYSYDNQGNLIKEVQYDSQGYDDYKWETTYIYDSLGNIIREEIRGLTEYAADGITTYSYDSQGNLVKEDSRWGDDITTRSYDSQGNLINTVYLTYEYDSYMDTYSYDNWGNCIQKVRTYLNSDGTLYEYAKPIYYYYTYDEYGNLIKEFYEENNATGVTEYNYDSQGNVLTEKYQWIVNDSWSNTTYLAAEYLTQYIYE